jgi:non-canonical (house-cleaning) NTP pyrophosphatase
MTSKSAGVQYALFRAHTNHRSVSDDTSYSQLSYYEAADLASVSDLLYPQKHGLQTFHPCYHETEKNMQRTNLPANTPWAISSNGLPKVMGGSGALPILGFSNPVITHDEVPTGVPNQPIQARKAMMGCTNRAIAIRKKYSTSYGTLSAENALFRLSEDSSDQAAVIVEIGGRMSGAYGQSCIVPDWIVDHSIETRSEMGKVVKALCIIHGLAETQKDVMYWLYQGRVKRKDILQEAFVAAGIPLVYPNLYTPNTPPMINKLVDIDRNYRSRKITLDQIQVPSTYGIKILMASESQRKYDGIMKGARLFHPLSNPLVFPLATENGRFRKQPETVEELNQIVTWKAETAFKIARTDKHRVLYNADFAWAGQSAMIELPVPGGTQYFEVAAILLLGADGRKALEYTVAFPLPEYLADIVLNDLVEVGTAAQCFTNSYVRDNVMGLFSEGIAYINRDEIFARATYANLCHYYSDRYAPKNDQVLQEVTRLISTF